MSRLYKWIPQIEKVYPGLLKKFERKKLKRPEICGNHFKVVKNKFHGPSQVMNDDEFTNNFVPPPNE